MAFTAADVKKLREMTGVGMMDCKKALAESDGDFDKAMEWLREKGLAASLPRKLAALPPRAWPMPPSWTAWAWSLRSTPRPTSWARMRSCGLCQGCCRYRGQVPPCRPGRAMDGCKYVGTDLTVTQQQQEMVLVIGENIKVRRFARFAENVSVPYVHAGGKIGVLVNLEGLRRHRRHRGRQGRCHADRRSESPLPGQVPGGPRTCPG